LESRAGTDRASAQRAGHLDCRRFTGTLASEVTSEVSVERSRRAEDVGDGAPPVGRDIQFTTNPQHTFCHTQGQALRAQIRFGWYGVSNTHDAAACGFGPARSTPHWTGSRNGRRAALVLLVPVITTVIAVLVETTLGFRLNESVTALIFFGVPLVVLLAVGGLPRSFRRGPDEPVT
jgi:hypothetical protein